MSTKSKNPCTEIKVGPTLSYTFSIQDSSGFATTQWQKLSFEPHMVLPPAEPISCTHCGLIKGSFVDVDYHPLGERLEGLAEYIGCVGPVAWLSTHEHWARVQILNGHKYHNFMREVPAANLKRL